MADSRVPDRYPWLDQIALPIAMRRVAPEAPADAVPLRWNRPYQILHGSLANETIFAHYHSIDVVLRSPTLSRLVGSLVARYSLLQRVLQSDVRYRRLLPQSTSS
eukprot:6065996-Prymnesium_polylepis.1